VETTVHSAMKKLSVIPKLNFRGASITSNNVKTHMPIPKNVTLTLS